MAVWVSEMEMAHSRHSLGACIAPFPPTLIPTYTFLLGASGVGGWRRAPTLFPWEMLPSIQEWTG